MMNDDAAAGYDNGLTIDCGYAARTTMTTVPLLKYEL